MFIAGESWKEAARVWKRRIGFGWASHKRNLESHWHDTWTLATTETAVFYYQQ